MEHLALTNPKVVQQRELERLSQEMRRRGERVVLTNGCFDLLHVGHVRYLAMARSLGDRLVVGLNSDVSVRRLKGSGHPITPALDRAEVLAALQSVDFVTIFDEDSASALVARVLPDVYVKGGDYSSSPGEPNWPVEGEVVRAYGGRLEIVGYVPGYSTTGLRERVRKLDGD